MMFANKKGAESTMGPMIWLIVILVVAALVIFFVAGGFGKIGDLFNQAPGTYEEAVQICNSIQTPATFCEQMRYIDTPSGPQYVNCEFELIAEKLDLTSDVECKVPGTDGEKTSVRDWGIYFCKNLLIQGKLKSGTKANDVLCESLSCEDEGYGGAFATEEECRTIDQEDDSNYLYVTKGFDKGLSSKPGCCIER
jgi:hypothetical protein